MEGYLDVRATCKTTDGRKIGWIGPVLPELFEDTPAIRGFILADLRDIAVAGDPPGEVDEGTLVIEQLDARFPR